MLHCPTSEVWPQVIINSMTVSESPETLLLERSAKSLSAKGKPADGVRRVDRGTVKSMLPTERTKSISVALYVLSSLAMTSLTKYAASAWQFPGSSLLLLIECLATVAALYAYQGQSFPN